MCTMVECPCVTWYVFLLLFASSHSPIAICFSPENRTTCIASLVFLLEKVAADTHQMVGHYFMCILLPFIVVICFVLIFFFVQSRHDLWHILHHLHEEQSRANRRAEETGIDNSWQWQWQLEFSLCLYVWKMDDANTKFKRLLTLLTN